MSTATYSSNLPTLALARKMEFGPNSIPVDKPSLRVLYRPLTLKEKISNFFGCTRHTFSWPQTRQDVPLQVAYPRSVSLHGVEFDSHQVCTSCGLQRFYNSKTFIPGPTFKWTDAGTAQERQQNPFDVYVKDDIEFFEAVQ